MKSHQLVQDKLIRDLEKVLDYVDFESSGFFSIRQVGEIFVILKVFKVLFVESNHKKMRQ